MTSADRRQPAGFIQKFVASDPFVFMRACVRTPVVTAALLPSGQDLSRAAASLVDPSAKGAVVELGPGTGPVSAALVAQGIAPERLILIEFNPEFCELLRRRYPTARIVRGDAFEAPAILKALNAGPLAAIVSFLPLYGKASPYRQRLLLDLLRMGQPGARFVQATYFPWSPIPIDRRVMQASASRRVWRNVPPAVVWTYCLRGET